MVLEIVSLATFICGIIIGIFATAYYIAGKRQDESKDNEINVDKLNIAIDQIPSRVLNTITGSINDQKGRLGELIGYVNLSAKYDKLIPFHDITDFIGIKFPNGDQPGTIDFIDIKNGDGARLTKGQTKFKKLIEDKRIRFIKFKVETDVGENEDTTK